MSYDFFRRFGPAGLVGLLLCCLAPIAGAAGSTSLRAGSPSAATIIDASPDGLSLTFKLGNLQATEVTTKEGIFSQLSAEGLARSFEIGKPNLPLFHRLIAIPLGAELQVQATSQTSSEISLTNLGLTAPVMPAQQSLSKSADPETVIFEYDRTVYSQKGYYQLPLTSVRVIGTMRALRLALVSIAPIQYDPMAGKLRVFTEVTVEVKYENADWDATAKLWSEKASSTFDPVYQGIWNYSSLAAAAPVPMSAEALMAPIKYLIVADRMFEAQLQPFIDWKIRKGFNVVTAYTDVIGYTNTAIKSYIEGLYNAGTASDPAPSFVLLVGDVGQIPPFEGTVGPGSHITDLPFCEFTGDALPEIQYGRFSAQTTYDLQPQIDKTLEYEQYLMPDPSYLGNVTLVAGVDPTWAPTHANGQINYGTTQYFNLAHNLNVNLWLYPGSDDPAAEADIIQTLDDGIGLYNYTAHCGHPGQADPAFNTGDLPSLAANHKYLLGIANCCATNTFGDGFSTPCFGEAFLRAEDKGGIGYIGASNNTFWDEDYFWAVGSGPIVAAGPTYEQVGPGAYDGLFHDHGETVTPFSVTNGAIISAGNLAVTQSGSAQTTYYWETYHLMGDPSVTTYIGLPSVNPVIHAASILLSDTSLGVDAAVGSYVGLSQDGLLLGAAYVETTGAIELIFTATPVLGAAELVVTGQNLIPYTSPVLVVSPSSAYVIFDELTINDASGTNDGLVDGGENILLGLGVINAGYDDALGCTATLTTTDPYVTITDATEVYGTVVGNLGTVAIVDAFAFTVSPALPDKHVVTFDLEVSDGSSWLSSFELILHCPTLGVLTLTIDDASGGNADGILDPGETGLLILNLENNGSGRSISTEATLSLSDQYTSLLDGFAAFGTVAANGGQADNTANQFEVSISATCPSGYAVPALLELSNATGMSVTLDIVIPIGEPLVIYSDGFAVNQGWTGMLGYGEWNIGLAGGAGGDPAQDYTSGSDNRLLGNDLSAFGQYNHDLIKTYWVTSPVIDCSDRYGITMTFFHWLGIQASPDDKAFLEVFDGLNWVTMYQNSAAIQETAWFEESYNLAALADDNPDFQIRFGIGPSDASQAYSGWNIDDLKITGFSSLERPLVAFTPAALTDSLQPGASGSATLYTKNMGAVDLSIWFTSDDPWIDFNTDGQVVPAGDSVALEVAIDGPSLGYFNHLANLSYVTNDADNLTGSIPVSVYVFAPNILLDQSAFDVVVRPDGQAERTLVVHNYGPGRLDYTVVGQAEEPVDWLTVTPRGITIEPFETDTVDLAFDASGLAGVLYTGSVDITCSDPDSPLWSLPVSLEVDTVCCLGMVGDANGLGDDVPTIGDVSALVDFLFITRNPLGCWSEADINLSAEGAPLADDVTIGDIADLVDFLFISRLPLPPCP